MTYVFYTERFIFKCHEENGKALYRMECIKFTVSGYYMGVFSIARIGEGYHVAGDESKVIRSKKTLLNVTKQYIATTYGKIENVVIRD